MYKFRIIRFRRKLHMHEYFSESAFGSQRDSKSEFRNLWKDPEYQKKHNLSSSTNKEKKE